MHRLLLTRRWVGFTVFALVVVVACVQLGRWQMHRAGDRQEQARQIEARTSADPVDVTGVTAPGARPDEVDRWRAVSATGRYDSAGTVLLRNRSVEGQRGYHVLVPLRLGDGTSLLVDRGFVPAAGPLSAGVDVPAPPAGEVAVRARLVPGDAVDGPGSLGLAQDGRTSVSRADPLRLGEALGERVTGAGPLRGGLLEATAEDPAPAAALTRIPGPEAGNYGLNLAYMVQWWVFAVIGVVGWWFLLRREALDRASAQGRTEGPAQRTRRASAARASGA